MSIMKKIVKNIIFLVAILSLSFGCLKSSENFYVVNSPNSLAKNLLISNRRGLLMEEDEDIELKILEDGKKIKTIVYDLLRDEEKEIPIEIEYLSYIGKDYYCYKSNNDIIIILDQNADVIKTFEAGYNRIMGPNRENKNYFFLTVDIDDKVKVILNNKFEKIEDVDYSFPTIEYEECYSYISDDVIKLLKKTF